MTNFQASVSGEQQSCVSENSLGLEHESSRRIGHHFLNDRDAKIILSSTGLVLFKNIAAVGLIKDGILTLLPDGQLSYGSSDLNSEAQEILSNLETGRSHRERLIKKHGDDWILLDFTTANDAFNKEVLLSIQKRNIGTQESLKALAKTFDFTITESEIVRHMSQAHCPKEISADMGITTNTVRAHLRSIYAKLGVRGYNRSLRVILQLIS